MPHFERKPRIVRSAMDDKSYVYALVRKDIPLAAQLVQVGHACLEAGSAFYRPSTGVQIEGDGQLKHDREVASLICLQVKDLQDLVQASKDLVSAGIRHEMFFEPDDGMAWSALATEPISGKMREHFKHFKLWK